MKTWLAPLLTLALTAQTLAGEDVTFESPEQQVGLLELYTSEGCSSCPPADRWLSSLQTNPRLWQDFIPIALHVDYWDYIGWKDPFASPAHSRRQRQYAQERSLKAVYTPGFVYNGKEWRQWYTSRKPDFPVGNTPGVMRLQVENESARVQFTPTTNTGAGGETHKDLQLTIALLGFGLATEVRAGENKGKTLPHDFVVLGMRQSVIKPVNGRYEALLEMPVSRARPESYGVVAWLNTTTGQRPVQAVGGRLPVQGDGPLASRTSHPR